MGQVGAVFFEQTSLHIELPSPQDEVLPGILWGSLDAFPTPAYWAYQVMARRLRGETGGHRLGRSLAEEVAACLLGGYGIPAQVGLAAFRRLQAADALRGSVSESQLVSMLTEPLTVQGRTVRYRFANQKARYLSGTLRALSSSSPPMESGRALRDFLVTLPGVGLKTSSWVARNWLQADDVAILDLHVLRAGTLGGFLDSSLTVTRNYLELEDQFIRFSAAIFVRPSELDSVIWSEMRSSPATVNALRAARARGSDRRVAHSRPGPNERSSHSNESGLLDETAAPRVAGDSQCAEA